VNRVRSTATAQLAPNDVVAQSRRKVSGSPTPPYGGQLLMKGERTRPASRPTPAAISSAGSASRSGFFVGKRVYRQCYRVDPASRSTSSPPRIRSPIRSVLAFSPYYKKLYVISTGRPWRPAPRQVHMHVFDFGCGRQTLQSAALHRLHDRRRECGPDGCGCYVDGNLWCSTTPPRRGLYGVTVMDPGSQALGRIRLPRSPANLCFAAPSAIVCSCGEPSLYALYVGQPGRSRYRRPRYQPQPDVAAMGRRLWAGREARDAMSVQATGS